jgi:predicted DsbA family dithiol-disulfide isomerase
MNSELNFDLQLEPFLLFPSISKEGLEISNFKNKSRPGTGRSIRFEAKEEGILFNFDRIKNIPNSLKAHTLIASIDNNSNKIHLAKSIFEAHFEDGKDISDTTVLLDLAEKVKINSEVVFEEESIECQKVKYRLDQIKSEFITIVPSLRICDSLVIQGLQSKETWEKIFYKAARKASINDPAI